jgi:hypothetical protein
VLLNYFECLTVKPTLSGRWQKVGVMDSLIKEANGQEVKPISAQQITPFLFFVLMLASSKLISGLL